MCRCECVTSSEQMRIWKRIILQQLAVCVHTCVHEFLFINPSLLVGPLPSPLSSPSEGRTHIPVQLPDSSPGRRSAGADKWQGPQHMRTHAHTHPCPSVHRHAAWEFCPLLHFCPTPPPDPLLSFWLKCGGLYRGFNFCTGMVSGAVSSPLLFILAVHLGGGPRCEEWRTKDQMRD